MRATSGFGGFVETVKWDLAYAWRQILRSPAFTFVAVFSLAVGIGVNVTIFSAGHALLRRPVMAANPDELAIIYRGEHSPLPRDWFLQIANTSEEARAVIAEDLMAVGFAIDDERERIAASVVSENFFSVLGNAPAVGTTFSGAPNEPVGAQVVLSHRYWMSRFGGDASIVGRDVRVNGLPFTVVGVAAEGFVSTQFGWGPSVFVPFSELPRLRGSSDAEVTTSTYVVARLQSGATPESMRDELLRVGPALPRADSTIQRVGAFRVERARGINAEVRQPAAIASLFLQAIAGFVLLIACANLGNLLLARAMSRRREIAIRAALGVRRARLIRQLLAESTLLTTLGGIAGFIAAWFATRALPAFIPAGAPIAFDFTPDANVLGFAAALAVGTGVLCGLLPALTASRADLLSLLRSGVAATTRHSKLRSAFLGGQIALALTLLIVSGLFLRGLNAARTVDPGFSVTDVTNLTVDLTLLTYAEDRGKALQRRLLDRVAAVPGVERVALVGTPPLTGSNSGTGVLPPNVPIDDRASMRGTILTAVTDGYFALVQQPILAGRAIDATDQEGTMRVAVVNESFARMFWTPESAVGQQFRTFGDEQLITVVGVTRDVKYKSLNDLNEPMMYLSATQSYEPAAVLQTKLRDDTPAARRAIRDAVLEVEPSLPVGDVRSAQDEMAFSLMPARIGAYLLATFAVLALLLASIGVYGVTAYLVGQRTLEIGIRSAIGSPASAILRVLMSDTLRIVLMGTAAGVALGGAIGKLASSSLYGISGFDPVAFFGASVLLLGVAMLGTWLPARRALRVDPMVALRAD